MLYICDFFTRHKEAVSNQIELLAQNTGGSIMAATRFMGQKPLRKSELNDKIFLFPDSLYKMVLPFVVLLGRRPIHYFEEEPSAWKRLLFNSSNRPLFISMYRRPTPEYAAHIKKYRNLQKIFVELDKHRDILVQHGVESRKIYVAHTPAKLERRWSAKNFDPARITIAFASWNNKEGNALHDRGLLYLIDILVKNPGFNLEIALRDNKTQEFFKIAEQRGVAARVSLHEIGSYGDLIGMFERCDFVAFAAQARVVKDVPNSLLDGLMLGKPAFLTDMIDFQEIVSQYDIGIVVPAGQAATELSISRKDYERLSKNAFEYSKRHTKEGYLKIIDHYKGKS